MVVPLGHSITVRAPPAFSRPLDISGDVSPFSSMQSQGLGAPKGWISPVLQLASSFCPSQAPLIPGPLCKVVGRELGLFIPFIPPQLTLPAEGEHWPWI